ncbi:MAG TPA: chaperone modulator CbpM [Gammaproteobacteria bacterium]
MGKTDILDGVIIDVHSEFTLAELCRACDVPAEWITELVDEGILEPVDLSGQWRFSGISLIRIRKVQRLQRDLGVNLPGAALALQLLDDIEQLHGRLRRFEIDF